MLPEIVGYGGNVLVQDEDAVEAERDPNAAPPFVCRRTNLETETALAVGRIWKLRTLSYFLHCNSIAQQRRILSCAAARSVDSNHQAAAPGKYAWALDVRYAKVRRACGHSRKSSSMNRK